MGVTGPWSGGAEGARGARKAARAAMRRPSRNFFTESATTQCSECAATFFDRARGRTSRPTER
eukprot:4206326-Pyramimonas_sp.AAC.1